MGDKITTPPTSEKWLAGLKKYILVGSCILLTFAYISWGPLRADASIASRGLDTVVILAGLVVTGTVASKIADLKKLK